MVKSSVLLLPLPTSHDLAFAGPHRSHVNVAHGNSYHFQAINITRDARLFRALAAAAASLAEVYQLSQQFCGDVNAFTTGWTMIQVF